MGGEKGKRMSQKRVNMGFNMQQTLRCCQWLWVKHSQSQSCYIKGWGAALDGGNESNYRMKGTGRGWTHLDWSKSLKGFKAGTARMNHGAGHAATTERSWGHGMGQEAGMGLCSWLRDKHCQDGIFLGAGTPVWLFLGDVGARSQPSQTAGNSPAGKRKQAGNPQISSMLIPIRL